MLFSALFWWHWQVSCAFRRSSASCAFKAASALCSARLSRSKASLSWAVKRSCGHLESQNFPNCISNGKPAHHYHPNLMSSHQIGMWKLDCTHEISSILQPHSWFSQGSKAFQDSSQNILHRVCVCVCVCVLHFRFKQQFNITIPVWQTLTQLYERWILGDLGNTLWLQFISLSLSYLSPSASLAYD